MKKRFISTFIALAMIIGLLPIMASAASVSGSCGDNVTWAYDTDTRTLTISGTGEMKKTASQTYYKYNSYAADIKKVIVEEGVTSVSEKAFYNYDSLESVILPESLTTIDEYAFYQCENLKTLTIPKKVSMVRDNAFGACGALEFIEVDDENPTFSNDENGVLYNKEKTILIRFPCGSPVTSFTVPDTVLTIEEDAFIDCDKLIKVSMPSVITMGDNAFNNCNSLIKISLPNVTTIGDYAFFSCDRLEEVSLPNVRTIGNYAFYYCSELAEISLPNATTIGEYAFYYCAKLEEVSLASVTSIERSAFELCSSLWVVYYLGTEEDWSKISINTLMSGNQSIIDAERHYCTEGEITESTCSEEGKKGDWYCNVCEATVLTGEKLALNPDNHTGIFNNGICTCGGVYEEPEFEDGYYQIVNAGNLLWFAELVNVHGDNDACAILKADIDLENKTWYPIGVYMDAVDASSKVKTMQYVGTFDGNYHSVSNFIAHGTGSQGLLGYCSTSAVVKNVGIIGADVEGWNAGAVIAYGGIAENCYAVDCNITAYTTAANANSVYAGSIAGAQEPVVKNCFAYNCSVNAGEGNTFSNVILSPIGGQTATNCYYYNITTNGELRQNDAGIMATPEQLATGEVAYKLGSAWGQKVGTDNYPVFYNGKNHLVPKLTVTDSSVKVETLFEDAVLIVASYKGKNIVDAKIIPVSGDCTKSISSTGLDVSNYDEIKAFLWKDLTTSRPLCEEAIYDNTDEFDGDWV